MILRIPKEEAAYLYQVLESYEGLTNHSTASLDKHLPYRDIQLHIAPDLRDELMLVIDRLKIELPRLEVLYTKNTIA